VTESGTDEPEEASRKSLGSRVKHQLHQVKQHKDLAVLGIGAVVSGVLTVIGIAHIPWGWLFGLGCAITAIAALVTGAVQASKPKERERNLWGTVAVMVVLVGLIFGYHEWWDPANQANVNTNGYQVMVNGGDVQVLLVYDKPGGSQTYEYPPLNSDEPVSLTCYVSLPTSGLWYEVYGDHGWVPRDAVSAIPGTTFPNLPYC
jgi:hypothetical protein